MTDATDAAGVPLPTTCPSCGAVVRQSVPWCLQCYANLRPDPDPAPELDPDPDPSREPQVGPVPPSTAPADVDAVAERMLAELRMSEPRGSGWLARLPSSRGGRAAAVAGLIAVLGLVLVLVLTLVGHLV